MAGEIQTLTEQMFYVLLTSGGMLRHRRDGPHLQSHPRPVTVGPGTLYNLLESFQTTG